MSGRSGEVTKIKQRDDSATQIERENAKQLIDRHMVRLKVADLKRRQRR